VAYPDPYSTRDQVKTYLRIDSAITDYDDDIDSVIVSATREINNHCSRNFNRDGAMDAATTRIFTAKHPHMIKVHDFYTITDLVIQADTSGTGIFGETWTASDYQLEPLNGIRDGNTGWPYFMIRAVGSKTFPVYGRRATVRVTAHFGWSAVPADVHQSHLMLCAETFKMREAPLGVAGWSEFGAIRVRDVPKVAKLLYPYEFNRVKIAVG
jgi:hypothetical protein